MIFLAIIYIMFPMEKLIDYFYKKLANNEIKDYN